MKTVDMHKVLFASIQAFQSPFLGFNSFKKKKIIKNTWSLFGCKIFAFTSKIYIFEVFALDQPRAAVSKPEVFVLGCTRRSRGSAERGKFHIQALPRHFHAWMEQLPWECSQPKPSSFSRIRKSLPRCDLWLREMLQGWSCSLSQEEQQKWSSAVKFFRIWTRRDHTATSHGQENKRSRTRHSREGEINK